MNYGRKTVCRDNWPVTVEETHVICREFLRAGYTMEESHIPMLGFLASYKTLQGEPTPNRRYFLIGELSGLLDATDRRVFTMIHYNSKEIETLADQVAELFNGIYEADLCRAIQLNIVWPDITQVAQIKRQHPEMDIVFQASHKAMEGKTPTQIAEGVKAYGDLLRYVLIDPSGGRGIPFDLDSSLAIYAELRERCPNLIIGFAGGFSGENVGKRVQDILQQVDTDTFCIDAEGGLRDKVTEAYGDDLLNINKVRGYLQEASFVLK